MKLKLYSVFTLFFIASVFVLNAQVTLAPQPSVCLVNTWPRTLITLTGGSPSGGVYSGKGVSNGKFDMIAAAGGSFTAGTYTITYTAIVGGVPQSATATLTVLPQPALSSVVSINTGAVLAPRTSNTDPDCIKNETAKSNCWSSVNDPAVPLDYNCIKTTDKFSKSYQVQNPKPGSTYNWGVYSLWNNGNPTLSAAYPPGPNSRYYQYKLVGNITNTTTTLMEVDSSYKGFVSYWSCNPQDTSLLTVNYRYLYLQEIDANGCSSITSYKIGSLIKPTIGFTADTVCLGQATKFNETGGSNKVKSWSWDFGDGGTSNLREPTHIFSTPGNHQVKLIGSIWDCLTCGDTVIKTVYVRNSTAPPITSCNTTVCGGSTITYSTPPGCSFYNWNAYNGTIKSGQGTDEITVEWSNVGPASLDLVTSCTNSACPPSKYSVPVLTNNVAIQGRKNVCYQAFSFFAVSEQYSVPNFPGVNYTWTVSGAAAGAIKDGQGTNAIIIDWAAIPIGSYQVSVNISHPLLPCQVNSTFNVSVKDVLQFSSNTSTVCYNTPFTVTVNKPGQFKWTIENGTILSGNNTNSITAIYNGSKTASRIIWVKGVGANAGLFCQDSIAAFPQLDTTAKIPLGITGNQYVCPSSIEKYTIETTNSDATYNWTPTNGTVTSTSLTDAFITWGPTGPYGLSVTQTNKTAPNCTSPPFSINVFDITSSPPPIQGSLNGCINGKSSFKVNKIAGATYSWAVTPPGIGSIIDGQSTDSITVQFTSTGAATISTSISLCATPIVSNLNITVNPSPAIPVITQTGNVCALGDGPGAVLTATAGASSYSWSSGQTINPITITSDNVYKVTVSNSFGCTSEGELEVRPKTNPNADISTLDPINVCPLDPINVKLNAIQPVVGTYQWYKDGALVSTNAQTYNATTTGVYKMITTTAFGCSKTSGNITITDQGKCACIPITPTYCKGTGKGSGSSGGGAGAGGNGSGFLMAQKPKGGLSTLAGDLTVCDGLVNFTSNTPNSVYWYWDFGDGTSSTAQNPTHQYQPGYYKSTYYVMFADSSWTSLTKNIIYPIQPDLLPPEAISCNTLEFKQKSKWVVDVNTGVNWSWDFGDGSPTSTAASPTHTYSTVGTYNVTFTMSDGASCTKTLSFPVQILPDPQARFFPPSSCINSTVQFRDSSILSTGGTVTKWLWNFGDGKTSTLQHPVYTYGSAGTYNVTLTITDQSKCVSTVTNSVVISGPPSGGIITANGPTTYCAGQVRTLTAPAGVSYLWSTGANQQTIIAENTGKYSCTVTYASGCKEKIPPITIIVNSSPPSTTGVSNICGASGNGWVNVSWSSGSTYQWFLGGSSVSTSSFYSTSTLGTYSVVVTGTNGCTSSSTVTLGSFPGITSASISGVSSFCEGLTSTLTGSVIGGVPPITSNWSGPIQSTPTPTTVVVASSGNLQFQVRDANGCSAFASVNITRNAKPKVNSFPSGCFEICYKDTFKSNLAGASTYQWYKDGVAIPSPTGTQANQIITNDGLYHVIATSSAGCKDTTEKVNLITKPLPTVSAGQDLAMCFAAGETVILDGSGSGTYSWTPTTALNNSAIATPTANPATTTNYTLTVKDINGCKNRDTMQVKVSCAQPILNVSSKKVCPGACAVLTASAGGGAGNYQYTWSTGQTGAGPHTICTVTTTTVGVTVTDNASNTDRDTATITMLSPMVFQPAVSNLSCVISTGSALALASGSTAPYTYSWNTGSTVPSIFNVGAGTYTLTATDANGCKRDTAIQILQLGSIGTLFSPTAASCGVNNGSISISPTGGTAPYVYSWNNGTTSGTGSVAGTNSVISSLAQGTYSLTVTDASAGACSTTSVVSIGNNLGQTSGLSIATAPDCSGNSNGSVTLTITGGSPNYNYTWSNGVSSSTGVTSATTFNITNLGASTYTVTVNDNNNCISTSTIQVLQVGSLTSTITATAASCGANNGNINISPSGGVAPYTYTWNNGSTSGTGSVASTSATMSGLAQGTYSITVTDAGTGACSTTSVVTVNSNLGQTSGLSITTAPACFGNTTGVVQLSITGGTPNYNYTWTNGTTSSTGVTSSNTVNFSSLGAGDYTVTVTDNNNCISTSSIQITTPAILVAAANQQTAASCGIADGVALAFATGGNTSSYSYSWSNTNVGVTANALAVGIYTVTITDGSGCIATSTAQITNVNAPVVTTTAPINISCNGKTDGSVAITVSGSNLTYTWSGGNTGATTSISGVGVGTYYVTVSDNNNCSVVTSVTLTAPPALVPIVQQQAPASCGLNNGIATASVSGGSGSGYNYTWDNASTSATYSNLSGGIYSITITDGAGCSITSTVSIQANPVPSITSITPTDILCNGSSTGSITVNATGTGLTYTWSNGVTGSTTINGLNPIPYSVTVTDADGCTVVSTVSITQPTPIVLTLTEQSPAICTSATGIALASASGGNSSLYNYVWSNSATGGTATNLLAAIYTVTVNDGNSCVVTNTVAITTTGATTLAITPVGGILCYGGNTASADIIVTGGTGNYNYEWDNGLVSQTSTSVNANFNIANLTAGNYTITVTDNNNCISTVSQTITQPAQVIVTANQQSTANCGNPNGVAIVNVNGGVVGNYTYQFDVVPIINSSLNSQSFTGLLAGTYTVTVTDNNGCNGTTSVTIQNSNPPNLTIQSTINTCVDQAEGSIVLDVSMGSIPYTYSWSDGVSTATATNSVSTYTIAGLIAANYTVSIIDANGCVATVTTTVAPLPLPTADAGVGASVAEGNSFQLNGSGTGTGTITYLWQPATYLNDPAIANPFTSPTQSITYTLMVTDANGCMASDTLNIKYIGGCIGSEEDVFVANVFSPNGDGNNDILTIQGNGLINITWNIYDRWGNKVFEANEQARDWDGTYNGKPMETGTYMYYIKATCKKTLQEVILKGNVSILK